MIKKYHLLSLAVLFLSFLTVKAQTANFTFTPQEGCDVITVQFTDASSGASSWLWKSNGVQFSTLSSPSNIFTTGTYVISLEINGGISTAYDTVHVYPSPVASFSTISDTTCVGVATQFMSTSTIGSWPITSYIWTWGDGGGDTVSSDTTSHVYTNANVYSANLVIYDSHGCHSQSIPHSIYVLPTPNVQFTMAPASGCTPPDTVTFTNTSTITASTYSWNFGDPGSGANNTASTPNASHIFSTAGTYSIVLTGTTGSCSDTYTLNFNLLPETASFNMVDDTICFGDTAYFSNTSIPAASYVVWNFGDLASGANNSSTSFTPYHIFTDTGSYTVTLIAYNPYCNNTITHTIYVRPLPVVSFTSFDNTNCSAPWTVAFTGTGTNIASWNWTFGDSGTGSGQITSHNYTSTGTFITYLIATDNFGCTADTVFSSVQIIPPTIDIISLPDSGCNPLTVFLQAAVTVGPGDAVDSITWNFGDGSPSVTGTDTISHTFNYVSPGIYTVSVTLTTTDGCTVTDSVSGLIRVGNHVSLTFDHFPDTVCYGDSVHFWSTTPPPDPPITAYNWSFGGRDSSCYLFTTDFDTGWVAVQLCVFCNGCGDSTNFIDSIYILAPKPIFTFTYDCNNRYTVEFQDTSHGADSIIWNWGDGTPLDNSNNLSPSHTYALRGDYWVKLTAYNYAAGCNYTDSMLIEIRDAQAVPLASPVVGCFPLTPFFVGSTSQDAISWRWNFDDPLSGGLDTNYYTSVTSDTVHRFNYTGIYDVRLIVMDIHQCVDTEYVQVQVNGPDASFTSLDSVGCMPFNAPFDASSSTVFPLTGSITQYYWNFNYPALGQTATLTTPATTHLYTSSGQYTVQLILTDANGCHDTAYHSSFIQVMHPYPSLVVDTFLCTNSQANFTGNITDIPGSAPYTFVWDFGDGSPIVTNTNVAVPTNTVPHTYTVNGSTNLLTLIVTDVEGCADTITRNITVLNPVAAFTVTVTDSCGYSHVQFTSPDTTNNYAWQWSITGPGGYASSSVYQNPFFNFTIPGTYSTTLTVTNPGCTATVPISGIVVDHPVAHFDYTPQNNCPPVTVTFTTHLDSQTPYIYVQWVFGDGNTAITSYPDSTYTYTYYTPGSYMPSALVAYTLSNGDTCLYTDTNSVNQFIIVTQGPTVDITQDSILLLEGQIDTLTSTYTDPNNNPPYNYTWIVFPDNSTLPIYNTSGAIYTADSTDAFIVLVLTDAAGCQAWDTVGLYIRICENNILIPNVFTPNDDHLNDTYYIKDLCPIQNFDIKIFNRWGNIVYQSGAYDFEWNGKDDNGKDCSEGTYYYVMRAKKSKLHGYIQLIRD
jgi:gliding motility-associated-like protein